MPGGKAAAKTTKGAKGNRNRKKGKDEFDGGLGDVDVFDQRFDKDEYLKKNAVHLNYDSINRDDYDEDDLK
eukprot:CAMPEP_0202726534 /NCGR_PEP_ID=MMETSP1385-20130828/184660_1 /ASSEMBLY_ACC=CAM_ASM_000861 /TAXON_ID=933848 /ORGANISM="Elphidium margaritaceum" /LENGTH=70 /DNA_ID=CAMNT_0049392755 /DNA_START=44 /DNA_END=256 /DNA_ORIENTATION=-